jgi:hypothetical protein
MIKTIRTCLDTREAFPQQTAGLLDHLLAAQTPEAIRLLLRRPHSMH